jgi:two-component system sensor histidine kinase KdpD
MRNVPTGATVREVLPILANHIAVALERAQLRERVLHAELLEEVDRLRRSLIGAVSHDLRTPLATIKVASSTFLDKSNVLSGEDADELHGLIDMQADRLTRLVHSLLDMTRIQSGALEVRPRAWAVRDLVSEAVAELQSSLTDRVVELDLPDPLPLVDVDPLLIVQVLANLVDNANRHGPGGTPITVAAAMTRRGRLGVSVSDHGDGVPVRERKAVFEKFVRFDTGGRSGLGLAIAKAFVEAHGEHIWVEEASGGGARFVFTLPLAATTEQGA